MVRKKAKNSTLMLSNSLRIDKVEKRLRFLYDLEKFHDFIITWLGCTAMICLLSTIGHIIYSLGYFLFIAVSSLIGYILWRLGK